MLSRRKIEQYALDREAKRAAQRAALLTPSRSLHRAVMRGSTTGPVPKSEPYRDSVLLEMQRGRPCKFLAVSNCETTRGETTVACHENEGKGMGIKAPDHRSAGGCIHCHRWYDEGTAPRAEKRRAFMAAHLRQVLEWRVIATDRSEPERFRSAARRALEQLNATPLPEEPAPSARVPG